ncbi:hypothetical protein Tco_1103166 [Tanacetum coccineum]
MSKRSKHTKDDEADSVDSSKYRGTRIENNSLCDIDSRPCYLKTEADTARRKGISTAYDETSSLDMAYARHVDYGNISIEKVVSEDNITDIFTKPEKCEVFNYLRLGLGMMELIMDSDSSSSQKYQNAKRIPTRLQDYKKTRAYAPKIYNDPNMFDTLRDIYRTLESRYVPEGRTIDPLFLQ